MQDDALTKDMYEFSLKEVGNAACGRHVSARQQKTMTSVLDGIEQVHQESACIMLVDAPRPSIQCSSIPH